MRSITFVTLLVARVHVVSSPSLVGDGGVVAQYCLLGCGSLRIVWRQSRVLCFPLAWLTLSLILNLEGMCSPEAWLDSHSTEQHYIPGDRTVHVVMNFHLQYRRTIFSSGVVHKYGQWTFGIWHGKYHDW